ncbi:beta-glucosidase [Dictyobacter arantiisoli]|uniref:Beta-glucosidase n=1 Tax=Dictyobacter arantiisoli TaxID=2014874 RepID=A0A5A5TB32_9CHLR|nr:glycoside hydrolase family 3 C-terminal domain-containing protein [Dictyobacter arantiisoli]GCF08366.1 beta-glucosidase [Dictyobacter arantiisoli]
MADSIDTLLSQMTLQEKVMLLAGTDMWHTAAIERLAIPALKVSDGPNGARGAEMSGGTTAACFPAGVSLAASWNTALVERIGQALGQETRTKGARVLLGPTVNIHRSPLGGRNFESFSEDPYLTGQIAVSYITGVQSQGVGATVKHYVANEAEFERFSIDSQVSERALREIYLAPFQAAIRDAHTWALMASYNLVNGVAASEHPYLLHDVLRDEWHFDGVVMSDWFFSVKSTAPSVNASLDLEMPGPGLWRGEKLIQAVKDGEVAESTIDESVRRLLLLLDRTGKFAYPEEEAEQAINRPEHRALIREAAGEGMVLLKNEQNILPLQREQLTSIAVIGPNARVAQIMGGGSAQVNPHYTITPWEGVLSRVGEQVAVNYELGCTSHKQLPLLDTAQLFANSEGTAHGLSVEYFNNTALTGSPVWTEQKQSSELLWFGPLPEQVDAQQFAVRARGRFVPQVTGTYSFSLISAGQSRFILDGKEVIDNWTNQTPGESYFGMGSAELTYPTELVAGQEYAITLEFGKNPELMLAAVRLGCLAPLPADSIERAATLAAQSDVALIFAGLNGEWESEGFDRVSMDLPGEQNALIARVAQANPRTIVVLNSGSPLTMPWLEQVAGVVQAWYPGQEAGNAIADVLFGDVNPSGKLPQTFPVQLEDNPTYLDFPGENGKNPYTEGVFVGYRYYEKKKIAPLFPFGFGLSYTTFEYSGLQLSASEIKPDETLKVSIDVTNTGQRQGQAVVQLYVRDRKASLQRPEKELKAFAKVALAPGERQTVILSIAKEALAYFDDRLHAWIAEAGEFDVLVGESSQDIHATAPFTLIDSRQWLS